ncbi:MAG: phosphate ABC transporter substrate-binding protein PstS [Candidatus Improbicoccus pseudotrichonymphae]|uniref:Phosphate ABC transporter substrate-binding protein PstS n=1 Tax=Candidatus Improbicoccus pseudotrichonymphae TaxID=3033792 RepID=A0AA48I7S1_9FIRM|nr:MAG: phosphate ABC transporter substrate-binding protein PstS [Candidatus Improbicoccus pseudotrichonymphae]
MIHLKAFTHNTIKNILVKTLFLLLLLSAFVFISFRFSVIIDPLNINKDENRQRYTLTSTGSTSMSRLLNVLGEKFSENYNGDYLYEKSETGSGAAINEVINGNYNLGDISRYLTPEEESKKIKKNIIAYDAVVVIVNKRNPIENLSLQEIADIFTRKINNWQIFTNENVKITTIGREEASGTREAFRNAFYTPKKLKAEIELPESGDIVSRVASDKDAIGFVSYPSVNNNNVRILKINGIECNNVNLKNRLYPIIRPFIQVYNDNNYIIEKWFEFIKSDKAKEIIENEKLIPVI